MSDRIVVRTPGRVNCHGVGVYISVILSVSETPSAGRPLFGTLCVPPLPLQRESILPEGWYFTEYNHGNIKSAGFAFPGDPSVNLRMTDACVMLSVSETSPGRAFPAWYILQLFIIVLWIKTLKSK